MSDEPARHWHAFRGPNRSKCLGARAGSQGATSCSHCLCQGLLRAHRGHGGCAWSSSSCAEPPTTLWTSYHAPQAGEPLRCFRPARMEHQTRSAAFRVARGGNFACSWQCPCRVQLFWYERHQRAWSLCWRTSDNADTNTKAISRMAAWATLAVACLQPHAGVKYL